MFSCNSLINFESRQSGTPTLGPTKERESEGKKRKREGKKEPRFTVGVASRGDFNETIARMQTSLRSHLRSEVRLLRATQEPWRRWRCRPDTRTVACRDQACTQFVSSSDNYAIMPDFLPLLASWSCALTSPPAYRVSSQQRTCLALSESFSFSSFSLFFFIFLFVFFQLLHHLLFYVFARSRIRLVRF